MSRARRFTFPLALLAGSMAAGTERTGDYLGVRFDPSTYALCQKYGCAGVQTHPYPGTDAKIAAFSLRRVAANVRAVLSPYGSVMSLEVWMPGAFKPASRAAQAIREIGNNAADETFTPERYARCFTSLSTRQDGTVAMFPLLKLQDGHYSVTCLRKTVSGREWHGLLVAFDR